VGLALLNTRITRPVDLLHAAKHFKKTTLGLDISMKTSNQSQY